MQTEVQRILSIVEVFGMKAPVSQAMSILQQTFYSKKDYKNDRHKFSEKMQDLIGYIKRKADKLQTAFSIGIY